MTAQSAPSAPVAPAVSPQRVTTDTWLIPRLHPAGPQGFIYINSMVITGAEPVVVDTGLGCDRAEWLRDLGNVVDPADVRWIVISHDDPDHVGNLLPALELCPNATVVLDFISSMRLPLELGAPIAPTRMRWLNPGESLSVGDRTLHAVRPPLFDNPTTRAFYDDASRVLWGADAFACPTPFEAYDAADLPPGMFEPAFRGMNSMFNPWHAWLDPTKYAEHLDDTRRLETEAYLSSHGPVLRGESLDEAYRLAQALAGQPSERPPGQPVLDEIIAGIIAGQGAAVPPQRGSAASSPDQ